MPQTLTKSRNTAKAYRFDARLNRGQRLLIQKAADIEGRTMSEFVLRSAQEAAERTIAQHGILVLSATDSEEFVDAILKPKKPGPVLRAAARRYKNQLGR